MASRSKTSVLFLTTFVCLLLLINLSEAKTKSKSRHRRNKNISGIDLLKGLKLSSKKQLTETISTKGVKFSDGNSGEITYIDLKKVLRRKRPQVTLEFIGYSDKKSLATLFGIYLKNKPLPLLEISLDVKKRQVILRYHGGTSFQRVTVTFGEELEKWTVLSATVSKNKFTVNVGCKEEKSVNLHQKIAKIPKKAFGVLSSGKYGGNQFAGQLFKARLYNGAVKRNSLMCAQKVSLVGEEGYQNDATVNGDRILLLEQQITQLNNMVDMLKLTNAELTNRVSEIEVECDDCVQTGCLWNGRAFQEGETWNQDKCLVCICKNALADCLTRTDIPSCQVPCQSANPCQNHGQCVSYDESTPEEHQCMCKPPYDGPHCEFKENPCVWPQEPGICDQNLPRYYYDIELQECLPFNYTGCGGNINNYMSLDECNAVAVIGACCFRQYSLRVEDVIVSSQQEKFDCKNISLSECQSTHRQVVGDSEIEVISFYPGVTCKEAECGLQASGCTIDERRYEVGERAIVGCQECRCESSGQFVCSCSQKAVRKEIRDMTAQELAQFQAAVQKLRLIGPGNPWEELRDIYMRHTMHSNGGPYFLPWHRLFLRKLEQKLQEIDCSITIPYYDFTTDVGRFEDAIVWQPNYFGGDGVDGCVPDHPFGLAGSWRPCIRRNFNPDIQLPTMIELSMAMASEDYIEMSMCLESYVSYIHTYIGGDMATRGASYDPIFYSIHAYIDMLYWWWQQKGSNKFKYPAAFGNIPMVPFNIPPSAILDLESDLCVTYLPPSKGHPCNLTEATSPDGSTPNRGDITPEGNGLFQGGFNALGYNAEGFDRRQFDRYGFKITGYNRDGFNRKGYDVNGFDRYGYDENGYNRYGIDIEGWDVNNEQDVTGTYNAYGLDMNCLDRRGLTTEGFDRYGFSKAGFDVGICNFFSTGPFATIEADKIWQILSKQSKAFLMTLERTCPGLQPLPSNWLQQYWITDIKDVIDMVPVSQSRSMVHNSARFCFDIDDYVTSCGCDVGIATCEENPCKTTSCPSYPEASCRVDFCGTCKARWFFNGAEVDCYAERDFCEPNPCENGGTCVASIWPTELQLTTCLCPPLYDGHRCQYEALDTCELPRSTGTCEDRVTRWHFDPFTQTCQTFIYTGCGGNSNNFESRGACEARCKVGACCYRFPKDKEAVIGYDKQMYDAYGFDIGGKNRRGDIRIEDNGIKTGRDRFGDSRYDWQGYDRNGYDGKGYDRWGLDKEGYDQQGFNLTGYDHGREYDGIIDYNADGYDLEGYNRVGYTCYGTSRNGQNAVGVYTEYVYRCRSATLSQCQRFEQKDGHQVVKFARGKRCEEAQCEEQCGCNYDNQSYSLGQSFRHGCQYCKCSLTGVVECSCSAIYRRKEVRDMSQEELKKYQEAIKKLNKMANPSDWFRYAEMYAIYRPQAVGNPASLPWTRQFLRMIEQKLQSIDCSITIPYYDWTVNAGNQQRAAVWAANIFGGDGVDINDCVLHHPFKDYYPPYWIPCLRRRFNTSVQLPDVVDIQYALNEPEYERFRVSMEVFMDIFKSWVGGHMDSEYSSYDPLFLSVAAFVDRVWWDWQSKYENGLLRYPQQLRYIPMMPFRSTPDDVMDSKKQMCVTYFPLTEGAACNTTFPNLNFDSMGYDRHGFNREGYDREGFSVFGLDKDGNLDERGIFNINGYDRQGFKRNGYDSMGWDRFGFFMDYNIDGYDSLGFDKSGYNRYGFNRSGVTPFSFHRNGTHLIQEEAYLFDPYGYNRYGFDRFGFDHKGYDMFGFDSMGYDQNRCNRHFLGSMLVIIKRWSELELTKVNNGTIRIITRICPPVSKLPEYRYLLNWMRRGDQVPLIEGILGRAQARTQGLSPEVRTSSVTQDNLWLPVGPDRSLCYVTYYYEECPFGVIPVECPEDLCQNRVCPGHSDAVCRVTRCGSCDYEWYHGRTGDKVNCSGCMDRKGVTQAEGTTWRTSECETCSCIDGLISCIETTCPVASCTHPVKIPGECCIRCNAGCDYDGFLYENGQTFRPTLPSCVECQCSGGSVMCDPVPCPSINCVTTTILDGECCPTCLDCGAHINGEVWKETPCQECTCVEGMVSCERIQCIPPDCSHPAVMPGECCPSCDACSIQGRLIGQGDTFMQDKCTECVCRDGNLRCDPVPCLVAPCLIPVTIPGDCCPTCDNACEYNGRRYRHDQSFLSSEDRCVNCTCDNTRVSCSPVTCPRMNLPCRRPITFPGQCCPTACPTCSADGRVYETGATWTSVNDPCETCVCEEGITSCQRQEHCPIQCDQGVTAPDQCCSPCTGCNFNGLLVEDGQTFVRPGDNCQQCSCARGQVTCVSLGPCPQLPCRVAETPPGACCPQCVRCQYRGQYFTHGDVVSSDKCSTCYCRDGEIQCDRQQCPEPACRAPVDVEGECCPVCLECQYKGQTYDEGQRFSPLREPCLDCVCSRGEAQCSSRESECPRLPCSHPIGSRKQCCPTCNGCSFLRRRFRNGQKFIPPGEDNCKVCKCNQGSVECTSMRCPAVNCHNAVLVKGQCCPVCPMGCNVMGIEYRDGQTFIDFMDRCQVCTCMMGEIRCMAMMSCAPAACTHPANRPGNCCPSCTMCEQNAVQYTNGETFTSPADPCQKCMCKDGSITCELRSASCPRANCIDPVLDPATCCPTCQTKSCMYAGRQYLEGQLVPASRDKCDVCTCSDGMVDCAETQCPEATCLHPGRDDCCYTCEMCVYNGMRFELGEMFPNPYEACEDCVCQAGTVECQRRGCDPPNCRDPIYPPGACCPVCSDCTFQGMLYRDGQDFQNPTSTCEVCHCMKGNVACDRRKCRQVTCRYPVMEQCCPVCSDCMYNMIRYGNQETFMSPDGCGRCTCRDGDVTCDPAECPPVLCSHPVDSGCCKTCTDCFHMNRLFKNGQSFRDPTNECNQCTCQNGTMSCDPLPCQPVTCDTPVQGRCCMECQDCNHRGQVVKDGDWFQDEADPCNECLCRQGTVQCRRRQCPAANCRNPVTIGCCPTCVDNCEHRGRQFKHGDSFVDETDPCMDCFCHQGTVHCSKRACLEISCQEQVLEGCCMVCSGSCSYHNQTYNHGDRFPSMGFEPCAECVCNKGSVECKKKQCPALSCSHPFKADGQCCPECTDCFYDNRVIQHGERFREGCNDCYCSAGSIECQPRQCPVVTCSNPTNISCCPTCNTCTQEGRRYGEGDEVADKRDPCGTCTCQSGSFRCARRSCPTLRCRHPAQGTCCPECHNCQIGARKMLHGDVYPDLDDKCSNCVCQSGTITCSRRTCAEVRCSDPVKDNCGCGVCGQGCEYHGLTMETGQTFVDPQDKCQTCTCRGGNVQCAKKPCTESCTHPADGDGCCPLCNSCMYEGQIQIGGTTFTPLDRCQTCSCRGGNVTCTRVECLVPGCENTQVLPGECCPTCASCYDLVTGISYSQGDVWVPVDNDCLTCMCESGSVTCRAEECVSLDCTRDEKPVSVPGQCCPQCQPRQGLTCLVQGERVPDWFEWRMDKCTDCQCIDGDVQCNTQTCLTPECGPDEILMFLPGVCCPLCMAKPATCTVFGDPHYHTFDGEMLHFQGTCKYIMAADCHGDAFSMEVQHDDRGVAGVSWAQNFTLKMGDIRVDILQGQTVLVNQRRVTLPYVLGYDISVEMVGDSVLLSTKLGVQLLWDGASHAELSVPGIYKRKMCGLCGDFNGFPRDDRKTKQGQVVQTDAAFGNTWKADEQLGSECKDAGDDHTCDGKSYLLKREANSNCEILFGRSFLACERVVPSLPYYASCVYDYCACEDKAACLCDILTSYARECTRAGVRLEWRNQTLCAMECDTDQGFIFDECGPVCPRTCDNWQTPLGVLTETCYKPCVPGCQCSADKVVHDGRCISPQQCPGYNR